MFVKISSSMHDYISRVNHGRTQFVYRDKGLYLILQRAKCITHKRNWGSDSDDESCEIMDDISSPVLPEHIRMEEEIQPEQIVVGKEIQFEPIVIQEKIQSEPIIVCEEIQPEQIVIQEEIQSKPIIVSEEIIQSEQIVIQEEIQSEQTIIQEEIIQTSLSRKARDENRSQPEQSVRIQEIQFEPIKTGSVNIHDILLELNIPSNAVVIVNNSSKTLNTSELVKIDRVIALTDKLDKKYNTKQEQKLPDVESINNSQVITTEQSEIEQSPIEQSSIVQLLKTNKKRRNKKRKQNKIDSSDSFQEITQEILPQNIITKCNTDQKNTLEYTQKQYTNLMSAIPIYRVLVFGESEEKIKNVISFLSELRNLKYKHEFQFTALPFITDEDIETNFDKIKEFLYVFKDMNYISACIFCVKESKDRLIIKPFIKILGSLIHANFIILIMTNKIKSAQMILEINNLVNANIAPPTYYFTSKDSIVRKAILDRITTYVPFNLNDLKIVKSFFIKKNDASYRKVIMEQLETLLEMYSVLNPKLYDIKVQLCKQFNNKFDNSLNLKWSKSFFDDKNSKLLVLSNNKEWKAKNNEKVTLTSPFQIVFYSCIGFDGKILQCDAFSITLLVTNIQNKDRTCSLSLYTRKKIFYQFEYEANQKEIAVAKKMDDETEKSINYLRIYLKDSEAGFNFIYNFFTRKMNDYVENLYCNAQDLYNMNTECVEKPTEIAYVNIDLQKDVEKYNKIQSYISDDRLTYLSLENCNISNAMFLEIMEKLRGTQMHFLSVSNNQIITNEFMMQIMEKMIDTKLTLVKIDNTSIPEWSKIMFYTFQKALCKINFGYDEQDKQKMKMKLLDKLGKIKQMALHISGLDINSKENQIQTCEHFDAMKNVIFDI